MWLLILIVVAAFIYLIIKSVNKYSRMAFAPIDVLRSRYFRSEIDRNEYE